MSKKVCVIGNTVADYIAAPVKKIPRWGELEDISQPIKMNIGGNGAIFSVCAAKLGASPFLVSKVGEDIVGEQLLKDIRKHGVDTTWTAVAKGKNTSITVALVNVDGERMFFHHIGCNAELTLRNINAVPLERMSAVMLCSLFILPGISVEDAERIFRRAQKKKVLTLLDVAWDPEGQWNIGKLFGHVDFFIPNEAELRHIAQTDTPSRAAGRLQERGMNCIIAKQGSKGCTVFLEGKKGIRIKAPRVKALDSTGAGDVFNAGFVYKYLRTGDVRTSAEFATYAASLSTTSIGGAGFAPTEEDVLEFISNNS